VTVELAGAELAAHVEERLRRGDNGRFVGVRLPDGFDPAVLLDDPGANGVVGSYERPDRALALVAVGEAERVALSGTTGAAAARRDVERLLSPGAESDASQLRSLSKVTRRRARRGRASGTARC